ncbi:MAG: putative metal-binding motif-containing protein, partial [Allomuricauda sp.]
QTSVYYLDNDEDGYGDGGEYISSCVEVDGYIGNDWDLDDADPNVGCQQKTFYRDQDQDGYGNPDESIMDCEDGPIPNGYVEDNTDCDDSNAGANPGVLNLYALDLDNDNFPGNQGAEYISVCGSVPDGKVLVVPGFVDCNDNNPAINPVAFDIPNNGIDENCNGFDGS